MAGRIRSIRSMAAGHLGEDGMLIKILNIVVRPSIIEKMNNLKNKVMWNAYTSKLQHTGSNCRVQWPFQIQGGQYVSIGDNFDAAKYLTLLAFDRYRKTDKKYNPFIEIGDNVTITEFCQISCINHIKIGNGVLFGRNVFVSDNDHGIENRGDKSIPPVERELTSKGPVIIGNNVWIGRNVTILSGITIGDGAVIGANAVVTHDIPAYCIATGCPAKVIKRIEYEL